MDRKKYTEANRDAWNEATHIHQKHRQGSLIEKFRERSFSTLDDTITVKLCEIGLKDKHVAQVFCNNGRELLSILNLGAAYGVGFDISDEAINEADQLKNISGLKAEFIRTDVFDIEKKHFNKFDLVYISIGGLTWVQDLDRAFGKIIGLLKPGGHLVIYDQHPFYFMLALDDEEGYDPAHPDRPIYSYFKTEAWTSTSGIDYVGKTKYEAKPNFSFTHKFADLITAIARKGIVINELREYPHDLTEGLPHLAEKKIIPLSYLLIGIKS